MLATRLRLQYYYDGTRKSQPLLQVIIEAPQSSGKQFAADIILPPLTLNTHHSTLNEWFYWLIDNVPFDQLGFESKGTTKWVHVSCKMDLSQNRQCIFRKTV